MDNPYKALPRNAKIPPFSPYDPTFTCQIEAQRLPVIDAQADAWFREARALEDPSIWLEDRNQERILELTSKAAERRHWKAMLNLASMYAGGMKARRTEEDAVILIEEAIHMGIPAAYDRMGTYYVNGTGLPADGTRGHAFWQYAAHLGNPQAQAYLGQHFNAGVEFGNRWSNIPVATKMLECAFAQGEGRNTLELAYIYRAELTPDGKRVGTMTTQTKSRVLKLLHEGVKLGCEECARALSVDFSNPISKENMLAPYIDEARAERYSMLNDALSFNPFRRFPNLDKILPLPPADLPSWDGTRDSLLAAAMGVTISPDLLPETPRPPGNRYFVDPAYHLRETSENTTELKAPFAGYWQPYINAQAVKDQPPSLYEKGETFATIYLQNENRRLSASSVRWTYHVTVRNSTHEVDPIAVPGLTRKVHRLIKDVTCRSHEASKASGIWQPWLPVHHPLHTIVNQPWRQVFLLKNKPFPQPRQDWLLDLDEKDLIWYLMEETSAGMVSKTED